MKILLIACFIVASLRGVSASDRDRQFLAMARRHQHESQSGLSEHSFAAASTELRALMMLLTYTDSERLAVAMRTWMPWCASQGFSFALGVLEPDSAKVDALLASASADLRPSLHVENAFSSLKGQHDLRESREAERAKTWSYIRQIAMKGGLGEKFDWFVQMDDDTLPDCAKTAAFLRHRGQDQHGVYLGPSMSGMFHPGYYLVMDRSGIKVLAEQLVAQPLRPFSKSDECTPRYADRMHETDCCVLYPMIYADVMIGSCLERGGVHREYWGADGDQLYKHPFKDPKALETAWKKLNHSRLVP